MPLNRLNVELCEWKSHICLVQSTWAGSSSVHAWYNTITGIPWFIFSLSLSIVNPNSFVASNPRVFTNATIWFWLEMRKISWKCDEKLKIKLFGSWRTRLRALGPFLTIQPESLRDIRGPNRPKSIEDRKFHMCNSLLDDTEEAEGVWRDFLSESDTGRAPDRIYLVSLLQPYWQ